MPQTTTQRTAKHRLAVKERMARLVGALEDIAEHPGPYADEACWARVEWAREALNPTDTKA